MGDNKGDKKGIVYNAEYDQLHKIIIVGSEDSGKSSLLLRFADDTFNESYIPTIGVDFKIRTMHNINGKYIKNQIWDTAGQKRFKSTTQSYYRSAFGFILTVNLDALVSEAERKEELARVYEFYNEIKKSGKPNAPIILVGTKCDRQNVKDNSDLIKRITTELKDKFKCDYIQTSAKTGENVEEALASLNKKIEPIYENIQTQRPSANSTTQNQPQIIYAAEVNERKQELEKTPLGKIIFQLEQYRDKPYTRQPFQFMRNNRRMNKILASRLHSELIGIYDAKDTFGADVLQKKIQETLDKYINVEGSRRTIGFYTSDVSMTSDITPGHKINSSDLNHAIRDLVRLAYPAPAKANKPV